MESKDIFNVDCPHCRKKYQVAQRLQGRQTRCKRCNKKFALDFEMTDEVVLWEDLEDSGSDLNVKDYVEVDLSELEAALQQHVIAEDKEKQVWRKIWARKIEVEKLPETAKKDLRFAERETLPIRTFSRSDFPRCGDFESTMTHFPQEDTFSGDQTIFGAVKSIGTENFHYREQPEIIEKTLGAETFMSGMASVNAKSQNKEKITRNLSPTGKYQFIEEIARGGAGIIYLARQNSLKRTIAVKKLIPPFQKIDQEKFVSEALVTAHLDHPNIVPVHELACDESGEIMLAMKLVSGISWKELIKRRHDRPEAYPEENLEFHLEILLNVCNAVAFAHNKGIVHNDLKPDNIMVGEFGEVLVMDWGIAVNISDRPVDEMRIIHKSMVKSPMGTPLYMPTELLEGRGQDIGPWTDVYLLGGILCEILTGHPPHKGKNLEKVLFSAYSGKLPEFNDSTPHELQDICHKALARFSLRRYQRISEFQQAIRGFLQHRESVLISDEGEKALSRSLELVRKSHKAGKKYVGERNQLYSMLSQAVANFDQALKLWSENRSAYTGQYRARMVYGEIALKNDDLGLAEAQAMQIKGNHPKILDLNERIEQAKKFRLRAKKSNRRWRLSLIAMVMLTIITLSFALFQIYHAKTETEKQRQSAEDSAETAKQNARTADSLRQKADLLRRQAELEKEQKAIELAQTCLSKAEEAAGRREMEKCGAYAGHALELLLYLKRDELQLSKSKLEKRGQNLVQLALRKNPRIWKTYEYARNISAVDWGPSKTFLATGSQHGVLRLWDVTTGIERNSFSGHFDEVTSLAFRPDGQVIASGSNDHSVRLWHVKRGRQIAKFNLAASVFSVTFSPDGKLLAAACANGKVLLWDAKTYHQIAEFPHATSVISITFHPGGKILSSIAEDQMVRFWNTGTKVLDTKFHHEQAVVSMAFTGTGKLMTSSSKILEGCLPAEAEIVMQYSLPMPQSQKSHNIKLWDGKTGKIEREIIIRKDISRLAFNHNRQMVVAIDSQKIAGLWHIKKSLPLSQKIDYLDAAVTIAYSANNIVASGSQSGKILLLDALTGMVIKSLHGHNKLISGLAFSPDGKLLASASEDKTVKLWDTTNFSQIKEYSYKQQITAITFSKDGSKIAWAVDRKIIVLWRKTQKKKYFQGFSDKIVSLAFSPDNKWIASCSGQEMKPHSENPHSKDKDITLTRISDGEQKKLSGHDDDVWQIAFHVDGKTLVSVSNDASIRLWDVETAKESKKLIGHASYIVAVACSPDRRTIASASIDRTIRLWDGKTGKQLGQFIGHSDYVMGIAFGPEGKTLASVSLDGTTQLWDVRSVLGIREKRKIDAPMMNFEGNSLAFSLPEGKYLAATCGKSVELWEAKTGTSWANFEHEEKVLTMVFASNGEWLATAGKKAIYIWNLQKKSLSEKFEIKSKAWPKSLSFCQKSKVLAASCSDDKVRYWRIQNQLIDMIDLPKQTGKYGKLGPGAKYFAMSNETGFGLWQTKTGKQIILSKYEISFIPFVTFSEKGNIVAYPYAKNSRWATDNKMLLWNLDHKEPKILSGHESFVIMAAAFNRARTLASISASFGSDYSMGTGTLILWDVATGVQIAQANISGLALAFSPDGATLASASIPNLLANRSSIQLWDVENIHTNMAFSNDDLSLQPSATTQAHFGWRITQDLSARPVLHLWRR